MRSWSLFLSPRFFDLHVLCKEQILPQTPRHYPNLDISEHGRIFLYKFNIIQRLLWFVMLLNNIFIRISVFRYYYLPISSSISYWARTSRWRLRVTFRCGNPLSSSKYKEERMKYIKIFWSKWKITLYNIFSLDITFCGKDGFINVNHFVQIVVDWLALNLMKLCSKLVMMRSSKPHEY